MLLALGLTVFITSCKKSEQSSQNVPTNASKKVTDFNDSDPLTVITNPNNQFETVGQHHNEGIDIIIGSVDSNTPHNYSIIQNYTNNYIQSAGYDSVANNSVLSYNQSHGYFNTESDMYYGDSPKTLINLYYNNAKISSTLKNYLYQIIDLFDSKIGSDETGAKSKYQDFAHAVIAVENQAQNDSGLTTIEHQIFSEVCSTARYSLCYWGNYVKNNQVEIQSIKNKSTNAIKLNARTVPFNWKHIATEDFAGALAGGIGGAVVGGLSTFYGGGIGAGPGAVGGAIGGGIVTSSYDAIKQIFGW